MNQTFKVFKFEFNQKLKQKSFYLSTIIIALIIIAGVVIVGFVGNDDEKKANEKSVGIAIPEKKEDIVVFKHKEVSESAIDSLKKAFNIKIVNSEEELKSKMESEKIEKGIVLISDLNAKVFEKSTPGNYVTISLVSDLLKKNYIYNTMLKQEKISEESYNKIQSVEANVVKEEVDKNIAVLYGLSYILLMVLYLILLSSGQRIATTVAKEKSSRTMELLITNVKPNSLIIGKVAAEFVVTIIQLLVLPLALYIGLLIKPNPMINEYIQAVSSAITSMHILVISVFATLGIILYLFLYAAVGSLINNMEELPNVLAPLTFLVVAAFLVGMTALGAPDSTVVNAAVMIPFTSPIAIIPKYLIGEISTIELMVSAGILVITTIALSMLAFKIYRYGTLNYGNKPNILKIITTKND